MNFYANQHEQLREIVVQFPGQPAALTLFGQGQFSRQLPEPQLRLPEFQCPLAHSLFQFNRDLSQLFFSRFALRQIPRHAGEPAEFSRLILHGGNDDTGPEW